MPGGHWVKGRRFNIGLNGVAQNLESSLPSWRFSIGQMDSLTLSVTRSDSDCIHNLWRMYVQIFG